MAEYIEREVVLKHLRECEGTPPEIGYTYPIFKALECFVEDVPAADVAPVVHASWEHLEQGYFDLWRCSACGDEWTFEYDPTDADTKVNYCTNCGARMIEEDK